MQTYIQRLYVYFLYTDDVTSIPIIVLYEHSYECDFNIFSWTPQGSIIHLKKKLGEPIGDNSMEVNPTTRR